MTFKDWVSVVCTIITTIAAVVNIADKRKTAKRKPCPNVSGKDKGKRTKSRAPFPIFIIG